MPDGALVTGWSRERSNSGGAPIVLGFRQQRIVGCRVGDEDDQVFQVFVVIDDSMPTEGCYPFQIRTYPVDTGVAWEY